MSSSLSRLQSSSLLDSSANCCGYVAFSLSITSRTLFKEMESSARLKVFSSNTRVLQDQCNNSMLNLRFSLVCLCVSAPLLGGQSSPDPMVKFTPLTSCFILQSSALECLSRLSLLSWSCYKRANKGIGSVIGQSFINATQVWGRGRTLIPNPPHPNAR